MMRILLLLMLGLLPWGGQPLAQTLSVISNMNFGSIEYAAPKLKGSINIGTNGTVTYGTNTTGSGLGTSGKVQMSAPVGTVAGIRCTKNATIAHSGGSSISTNNVAIRVGSTGPYGSGTNCRANLNKNTITHTITATPAQNVVYIAAQLNSNNVTVTGGTYSSSISGGVPILIRVIFQ